jgi:hypothetical protein
MNYDPILVSSKIKELIDLHKSGKLSSAEYQDQIKPLQSWLYSQLKVRSSKELKTKKESLKVSKKEIRSSAENFEKEKYDLLKSDIFDRDEEQPIKQKVQKILWLHLN